MKKYLFLAVAALGFAACAEKGLDNNDPANNGELEQSYVAITLAASDMNTKAAGDYEAGLAEERAVKSAYVFFFKDGKAFPVAFNDGTSTNAGSCNYLKVNLTGNTSAMPNVSDIKDAVLVLQNYKGEYPNQIVAVLNWTPASSSYTLENLQAQISELGDKNKGFVMSNAVYADNAKQTVDAVDLTIENIGKTEGEALANPVTIHVERVAAKVAFSANSGIFEVGEVDGKKIYAQIKGFQLYNDYQTSWLIKRITPTWENMELGFGWNDPAWFRSYWATSLDTAFPGNTFEWDGGYTELGSFVYCGENTRKENDVRTKVIVKAALVNEDGTVRQEVVNWYGKDYIGEGNLLKVVANTLKNTYFSGNGTTFTGLAPEDIKCVGRDMEDENAYEVYFQLSTEGTTPGYAKTWYKYENGNYSPIDTDKLNEELAAVQPALVYNDGMTYYYTDITGYGTPIYNGETDFITPEKPKDITTYVSAQINILSWRVVANDYQLN